MFVFAGEPLIQLFTVGVSGRSSMSICVYTAEATSARIASTG